MLATHLLFLDDNLVTSRIVRQSQGFPEVKSRQEQLVAVFHVTSLHDHQRVPHSFRDSQLSVAKSRRTSNTRAPLPRQHKQGTRKDSTALRYHDCCLSALCPVRNPVLETCKWAVQLMMGSESSLSMSSPDWKQMLCNYGTWMVCGSNKTQELNTYKKQ